MLYLCSGWSRTLILRHATLTSERGFCPVFLFHIFAIVEIAFVSMFHDNNPFF